MDSNRLFWDTPLSELQHSDINLAYIDLDDELMHWKYVKREKLPNGKWRYYYDKEQAKSDLKKAADKVADRVITKANQSTERINNAVDKAKTALGKWYDNRTNIYDVNRKNYTEKLAQIKDSKEWKDIVARKDSEYVKKDKDGNVSYDVDKYLVDKKHPVLDAIGDIVVGREVKINEITKDSVVAGLKDYANTTLEIGMLGLTFLTNGLTKKFKYSQGSYDEDVENLLATAELGAAYVDSVVSEANTATSRVSNGDSIDDVISDVLAGTVTKVASKVDKDDVAKVAEMLATAKNVTDKVRDDNVVEAAKLIVESDTVRNAVGDSEYHTQISNALEGLSEEEIMLINMLIHEMRK